MAKKETILTELEKQLTQALSSQYDFAIEQDSYHHRITLYFRLFVENKGEVMIEDEEGVLASNIIEFEDCIIFHQAKDTLADDEALALFSFDRKKGMEKAQLYAIAQTLQYTLEEGESDLMDFVTDETKDEFELHFDDDQYTYYYNEGKQKYQTARVSYPKF